MARAERRGRPVRRRGGSFSDEQLAVLRGKGYRIVRDPDQLDAVSSGKVLGLFADGHLASARKGRGDYLPRATQKALEILDADARETGRGFLLMVEGSQIDWAGHDNDAELLLAEMTDFDRAVSAAMDFADDHPGTLVVVTADHETGGLSIPSNEEDFHLSDSGVQYDFSTGAIRARSCRFTSTARVPSGSTASSTIRNSRSAHAAARTGVGRGVFP